MTRDDGFTLMETLVATFIFALVSVSAVLLVSSMQRGEAMLASADDRMADLQYAHSLLKSDLQAAIPRPFRDVFGGGRPMPFVGARAADGLLMSFVRGGHMAAVVSEVTPAIQRLEYRLTNGALVRRAYARPDITPDTPYVDQTLVRGIKALDMQFRAGGTWASEWTSASLSRDSMPRMVRLDLTFADGRRLEQVFVLGGVS